MLYWLCSVSQYSLLYSFEIELTGLGHVTEYKESDSRASHKPMLTRLRDYFPLDQ